MPRSVVIHFKSGGGGGGGGDCQPQIQLSFLVIGAKKKRNARGRGLL